MLEAKDSGSPPEPEIFDARVSAAVAEVVRKQVEAGVDVISDGEQGKVGYSTYVRHRMSGFDGQSSGGSRFDWADFPEAAARFGRRDVPFCPACDGPIEWKDPEAVQVDIANLRAALSGVNREEVFMTAASPVAIANFLPNEYYPSREAYLARLADVMKEEYDAIHQAGFLLQLDCPDLTLGRHTRFSNLGTKEFLKIAEINVEMLNHALRDIPPRPDTRPPVLGKLRRAAPPGHPPEGDYRCRCSKRGRRPFPSEGANPRHEHEWVVFRDVKLPADKLILPGVLDSTTNFIEHPELVAQRIIRYAEVVGRENVIAGSDCGFGTFARTRPTVEPEIVWEKLRAMAEGAKLASKALW